jgi:O-methyltransferase
VGMFGFKRNSRSSWVKNEYIPFGQDQRRYIFMSIARFGHINRPIVGNYFEFGCHGANTMRMAWDCFHHLFKWNYVAFDSFEGLPEIPEIDQQKIWEKGKLKTTEEAFRKVVVKHGIPNNRLTTVKGFYNETLTSATAAKFLPEPAAVIYIDCDLYSSTVPVLEFCKPFLKLGSIIVFDDWFCFHGLNNKGERRAFNEFRAANPEMVFEDFVQTNEAKSFIYQGLRSEVMAAGG